MKISNSWLTQYVQHPLTGEELGHAFTMSGLELEEIKTFGTPLDGVVVGHVLSVAQHPNADRLTLCQVDIGEADPVQIVCGAPNVAAGQRVPVACVGARLLVSDQKQPGAKVEVRIRKSKLRGEVSLGMICAEDELGLSDDHSGIMILDDNAAVGAPLADYLEARGICATDTVLDLAITPNRPDAICHIGVARDVAALCEIPLQRPDVRIPESGGEAAEHVQVDIKCPDACRRYVSLVVRNVTVAASPLWLRRRLEAIGLRPINNIVDTTNYVMYECGQPLHAFDYDCIAGKRIIVRQAASGEQVTTLDGKRRAVPEDTVLICDAERPVALGGIMGGANSEVSANTTTVLIESAWFDPSITRRSAKKLGIATDASYRFERGVDAEGQAWAAARAVDLMVALAGGAPVPGLVDCHPRPMTMSTLDLRLARIEKILGIRVPTSAVIRILKALGFGVEASGEALRCRVPSFRPDVEREIDLIEEVARIHGYDAIDEPAWTSLPNTVPQVRSQDRLRNSVDQQLVGRGYREIVSNSLIARQEADRFADPVLGVTGGIVETLNAVSRTMTTLRPSLLPGLLRAMGFNVSHGQDALRFYEFGHIFQRSDVADSPVAGYEERESFLMAITGPDAPTRWDQKPRDVDFFDLKGDVESLLEILRAPDVTMTAHNEVTPLTDYHMVIRSEGKRLGCMARVRQEVAQAYGLRLPAYFAEFDWTLLVGQCGAHLERRIAPVARHPVVERDIAVVVGKDVAVGPMLGAIRKAAGTLLRVVDVFDLYQDARIGAGHKSVAFSLRFQADRTLTDAEVDRRVDAIVKKLSQEYGARLRQ